jgi:hypothetical protein
MDHGWSQKQLHRLLMLSSVYQQESRARTRPDADPGNRLIWRMEPRRLEFEAMRDALLATSGELDLSMGGRSADLFQKPYSKRRAVYGFIDRQFLPGVLRMFDYANPDMHSPHRSDTTVPQQALFFMNSPFVVERARALAKRIGAGDRTGEDRIRQLYQILYQRSPSPEELRTGVEFLGSNADDAMPDADAPQPTVWAYGYGELDEAAGRIGMFHPLPHFTGEAWQGGEQWPDSSLGWVQLTAGGGHAGNDLKHAAIRRWMAPFDGRVSIKATLRHEHTQGDGIRAFLVSSRGGVLGKWVLHNGESAALRLN